MKQRKTDYIMVRCSPEQKDQLVKNARLAGMSLSEYVRAKALSSLVHGGQNG